MSNLPRKFRMLVHVLGLSSIASALFLQTTVFTSIAQNGYFRGVESNRVILFLRDRIDSLCDSLLWLYVYSFHVYGSIASTLKCLLKNSLF